MVTFRWDIEPFEASLATITEIKDTDDLYKILKDHEPKFSQDLTKEDIDIRYGGFDEKLKERVYVVRFGSHGVVGYTNEIFCQCEICKKDYLYDRSTSKKYPHKCCSNVCEQEMLKKNKEFVDGLTFSYIELQNYQEKKRILFKINDLLMDYNLVLEKKNNKWVIEEERKYVWHQMYKRENPELQTTKEKYCELCKKWSNHCSDFLNEMIDEIYEKIIKVPTVRIELLF